VIEDCYLVIGVLPAGGEEDAALCMSTVSKPELKRDELIAACADLSGGKIYADVIGELMEAASFGDRIVPDAEISSDLTMVSDSMIAEQVVMDNFFINDYKVIDDIQNSSVRFFSDLPLSNKKVVLPSKPDQPDVPYLVYQTATQEEAQQLAAQHADSAVRDKRPLPQARIVDEIGNFGLAAGGVTRRKPMTLEELQAKAALVGDETPIKALERLAPDLAEAFRARKSLRQEKLDTAARRDCEDHKRRGRKAKPRKELERLAAQIGSKSVLELLAQVAPDLSAGFAARQTLLSRAHRRQEKIPR
jgi:hypothetical protein